MTLNKPTVSYELFVMFLQGREERGHMSSRLRGWRYGGFVGTCGNRKMRCKDQRCGTMKFYPRAGKALKMDGRYGEVVRSGYKRGKPAECMLSPRGTESTEEN